MAQWLLTFDPCPQSEKTKETKSLAKKSKKKIEKRPATLVLTGEQLLKISIKVSENLKVLDDRMTIIFSKFCFEILPTKIL